MKLAFYLCLVVCSLSGLASSLMSDLTTLASDEMLGRKTGTKSSHSAALFIEQQFLAHALTQYQGQFLHPFNYRSGFTNKKGVNVIAQLGPLDNQQPLIVFTAHYDHLGQRGHKIFNGADDNASGVAALLHLARQFKHKSINHTMLFVATDAEENGLYGAKALVKTLVAAGHQVVLNINLDMLAIKPKRGHVFAFADKRLAPFEHIIEQYNQALNSNIIFSSSNNRINRLNKTDKIDWRRASDHSAFREQNIPFLYFGVGTHKYYHTDKDNLSNIDVEFYHTTVQAIELISLALDQQNLSDVLFGADG